MDVQLPFRQIHLDFHTSEAIENVAADFDPEVFADTLQRAHVNSINLFARGHHGWIYYDTQRFPERRHPHLTRNLLAEQIAACHARGIRTPAYVTVQWDHYTAQRHPEWCIVGPDGRLEGTPPYEAGFYRRLCLNSPYVDWLKSFCQEVIETLPIDGLWLDIVHPQDCSCWHCRQGMLVQGLEPSNPAHRAQYGRQVLHNFERGMTEFIHGLNSELLVFYNAGHVGPGHRAMIDWFTHLELESLPSGGWGYLHFPITARYARTLGKDYLGMTGKFHTSWGDFHSFKNRAALEFECFHMLALNAKCSVGDQLLPSGRICPDTYRLIGDVFAQVKAKEPWCEGAMQVAEVGVLTPEEFDPALHRSAVNFQPIMGATRMLQEGAQQFDILDSQSKFHQYKILILPDLIPVSESLRDKLNAYLAQGGAIIASFASGMDPEQQRFTLDALGVQLAGEGPRDAQGRLARGREYPGHDYVEYILPRDALAGDLPRTEHAMYMRGMEGAAAEGVDVLADVVPAYFDRTYAHFCSHRQTPSSGRIGHPAVVQNGRAIYFSQPVFSQYQTKAPRWCRELVLNALARLLPEPLVRVQAPTGVLTALNAQPEARRWVLHLLYYVPERRGDAFDVIEDVVPLYDIDLTIRTGARPQSVRCVPEGEALPFEMEGDRVHLTLPRLLGHQMIELAFD